MPDIDVRLDTGELSPKVTLQTERSYGTVLDIELAKGVTANGSPDAFREFFQDGLDLVNLVAPQPSTVLADIPPHDGLEEVTEDAPAIIGGEFSVGDRVRCINGFTWRHGNSGPQIAVGDERIVDRVNWNDTIMCYSPDGEYECWNVMRFERFEVDL